MLFVAGKFCLFFFQCDQFLQIVFEQGESVSGTGADPAMKAAGAGFAQAADEGGTELDLLVIVFEAKLYIPALVIFETFALIQFMQKVTETGSGQPFVCDLGKACQLAATG